MTGESKRRVASWLILALVFGTAAWIRFSLPSWPLVAPDSFWYLAPALTGNMADIGPRTFVYPLFCRVVLGFSPDASALTVVQQFFGLLGPAVLLFGWLALSRAFWSESARICHFFAGLALTALLLFSATVRYYEQIILIEGFHAFFQCSLAATLCIAAAQLARPRIERRLLLPTGTIAFLAVAMYFINPRWGGAAPATVLIALALATADARRLRAVAATICATVFAAVLFGLPQSRLEAGKPWNKTFTHKHLLFMHANLAVEEFRRDLAEPLPSDRADLLRILVKKIDAELLRAQREGTGGWYSLNFTPERLLYSEDSADSILMRYFAKDPEGYSRFCLHYYSRIIRHQTLAYASKVYGELKWFYAGPVSPLMEYPIDLGPEWAASSPHFAALAKRAPPGTLMSSLENAAVETRQLATSSLKINSFAWLRHAGTLVNRSFLITTVLVWIVAVLIGLRPTLRRPLLVAVTVVAAAASAILFSQILTLSAVTVSGLRYTEAVRSLAVFSFATSMLLVVVLAHTLASRADLPKSTSPP